MPSLPFQIDLPRDWIIEAEAWQWAAVIGMAGAIALGLYGWNAGIAKRSTGQGLPGWGRWAMGLMRFCALGIMGFLLLEPLIQSVAYDEEKPVAIVLVDESASVLARTDATTADTLNAWSDALVQDLSQRGLEVERYGFAGELRPIVEVDSAFQWDGAQTNLECGHPHPRSAHRKPQRGRHRSGIRWAHQPRCLTCLRRAMAKPPGVDRWIGRHHRRS